VRLSNPGYLHLFLIVALLEFYVGVSLILTTSALLAVPKYTLVCCNNPAPIFHKLSESSSLKDRVVFLKIDVDENHETAAKYSVSAMPTFVFIKKGDVVDRLMGANAQRLQSMIEEIAGI